MYVYVFVSIKCYLHAYNFWPSESSWDLITRTLKAEILLFNIKVKVIFSFSFPDHAQNFTGF